jgi:hypothetical protein
VGRRRREGCGECGRRRECGECRWRERCRGRGGRRGYRERLPRERPGCGRRRGRCGQRRGGGAPRRTRRRGHRRRGAQGDGAHRTQGGGLAKRRLGLAERRGDRPERREGLARRRRPRGTRQRRRARRTTQRDARAPGRRNRASTGRHPVRQRCECSRCPARRLQGDPGGWTSVSRDRRSGRRGRHRGTQDRRHSGRSGGRRDAGDGRRWTRLSLRCPTPPRRRPGGVALRGRRSGLRRGRRRDGVAHPAVVAHPLARPPSGESQGGWIGGASARRRRRRIRHARNEVRRRRGRHPSVQRTGRGQSRRLVIGQDMAHLSPGGRLQRGARRVPGHLRDRRCVLGSRGGGARVRAVLGGGREGRVSGRCGRVCDGVAGPRIDQRDLAVGADGAPVVPLPALDADKLIWHFERMMLPNPPTVPFRHSGVTRRHGSAELRGSRVWLSHRCGGGHPPLSRRGPHAARCVG